MSQTTPEKILEHIRQGDADSVLAALDREPKLIETSSPESASLLLYALYNRQATLASAIAAKQKQLSVYEAAALGSADAVQAALDADSSLTDSLSPDGFPLVALAAFFGRAEVVKLLAERGADVNRRAENALQVSALHAAVSRQDLALVECILDAGGDPNLPQQQGFTPLHAAAMSGNVALVSLLMSRGADPALINESGKTAAELAAASGHMKAATAASSS